MKFNPITLHDGYKFDHRRQSPPGLEYIQANFTPRTSRRGSTHVVFAGLQFYLQEYMMNQLESNFFNKSKDFVLNKFKRRLNGYLPGNNIGADHIADFHSLGYVPLQFSSLPEGTRCPIGVPMFTVENTIPEFAWLVNLYETLISSVIWPICTSATSAYNYRILLDSVAKAAGNDLDFVPWQAHDFSARGMMGPEAQALSGFGHLLSFYGTDSIAALDLVDDFYFPSGIVGGGVPATEHSVMCQGGKDTELVTFSRLLDLYPTGPVSVVSDTWNLWEVLTTILPALKSKIMSRDGTLVVRPDSGDPVKIICGDETSDDINVRKGVVELLWDTFGGTETLSGLRKLDSHVNVIYGDSITLDRAQKICYGLMAKGFCPTVVLGVGSFTYQYVTRDTEGFAMKTTWAQINGESVDLFKKPITDDGTKFSAKGRLAVTSDLKLIQGATTLDEHTSMLQPVWRNSNFLRKVTLSEIRTRLHPDWKLI